MSTRANVVIKDGFDELWFYRHNDGYPQCTMKTLKKFVKWVGDGKIRPDVTQASGWLVILGHREYKGVGVPGIKDERGMDTWKVGAYEPTTGRHGDVAYVYEIDLNELTIKINGKIAYTCKGY